MTTDKRANFVRISALYGWYQRYYTKIDIDLEKYKYIRGKGFVFIFLKKYWRMVQMEKNLLQGLKSKNIKKIRIAFQMLLLVDIHCNLFPLTYSKICVFKKSVIRKKLRFFSLYFNTFTIDHSNNSWISLQTLADSILPHRFPNFKFSIW